MPLAQTSVEVLLDGAPLPTGLPVAIGVPFERGSVLDAADVALTDPVGNPVPAAARALVKWPDGSVRWALISWLATQRGTHHVSVCKAESLIPTMENAVRVTRDGDTVTLDNGLVSIVLSATGKGPVHDITGLGHAYLARPDGMRFVVGTADTTRESARTIQVLEDSPLRVRVRVAGAHYDRNGQRLLSYRLDAELWAGWPTLRLDYQFFNLEPDHENIPIERIAMEWDLAMNATTQRHFLQNSHGLMYVPREVLNGAPVAIVADDQCGPARVEDPVMLLDDVKYPAHLRPPLVGTSEWLGVSDASRSVYVRMQDFMEMRPKRLISDERTLHLEFWPSSKGLPALPQGRSRRQVVTIAFSDQSKMTAEHVEQNLDAPLHEGRAIVSPAWLHQTGEFDMDRQIQRGANVRFERYLGRLVNLKTPQDMFDLGDTIDSDYCRTYLPIPNNLSLKPNAPALRRVYLASPSLWHTSFADWAMPEFYEPVWANNEYDGIHALCSEIMRAGRGDLWPLARWCARHNIEVDFVHYHDDRQQNRGSPQHSGNHNRSAAIPSHFWTQGLLQYYCMTGDPDVLDVAMALGDKIIEDLTVLEFRESFWGFTRELGWPLIALVNVWDITGEERYRRQLDEITEYVISHDRERRQNEGSSPFSAWSMIEGIDRDQRLTDRRDSEAWLLELCEDMRDEMTVTNRAGATSVSAFGYVQLQAMAIGYERTGQPSFIEAGLVHIEELTESRSWSDPTAETVPMAVAYRGLTRFLYHAHVTGLLDWLEYASVRSLRMKGRRCTTEPDEPE